MGTDQLRLKTCRALRGGGCLDQMLEKIEKKTLRNIKSDRVYGSSYIWVIISVIILGINQS